MHVIGLSIDTIIRVRNYVGYRPESFHVMDLTSPKSTLRTPFNKELRALVVSVRDFKDDAKVHTDTAAKNTAVVMATSCIRCFEDRCFLFVADDTLTIEDWKKEGGGREKEGVPR